jgi:hypothetical protein
VGDTVFRTFVLVSRLLLNRGWRRSIDYWWVRAGSIEILELFGIDRIKPPLRTRTGEYVGGGSIDLSYARSTVQSQFINTQC